jgi:signal transduction histidine kinase
LFLDVLERRKLDPGLLEDQTGGRRAAVDPTLITRALDNLLDNAERHGCGVAACLLRIEAAAGTPSAREARALEHLIFEVRDAGPGFEPRTLPRVFEAFYRAGESGRTGPASLGLGLTLVQRIARAHGGRAWAENAASGGASVGFSVAL